MKIAVTGKGGVGKTTLVAALAWKFVQEGRKVLAIDADPDTNLALTLGFPSSSQITSLLEMKGLIEYRTGVAPGPFSTYFRPNPRVNDIPDKYFVEHQGIKLAVMGTVREGGMGCTCPENAFLKALLSHLFLQRNEDVILDMEAGIEHLGRGTAEGVDYMIVVVEPSKKSVETAYRINDLARQIGISRIGIVANKIREPSERDYLIRQLRGFSILGYISFNPDILKSDLSNSPSLWYKSKTFQQEIKHIVKNLNRVLNHLNKTR